MKQIEIRKRIKKLHKEWELLKKNYDAEKGVIQAELKELSKLCNHSKYITQEFYNDGSYLDKASTKYKFYCLYCGEFLGEETEVHSYYG